jgi:hypothetical protein
MKFSFPVTCACGETFLVHVAGTQFPKSAQCHICETAIWLVEPLGNVVGMAILGRAATEMKNGDWTLAIVLAAMAVECELVYRFMKWNRIDLMLVRNPTDADDEEWEKQWRDDVRTIAARFDKVSGLLTGQPFDSFLSQNSELLKNMYLRYPASKSAASLKDFFVKVFLQAKPDRSLWNDRLSAAGCGNVLHAGFNAVADSGRNGRPSSPCPRGETLHSNAGSRMMPDGF